MSATEATRARDQGVGGRADHGRDLFGRGMLYVLIWSMQTVVSTVVSPILAHVLGPADFGALASVIALYQLLIIVAVFGLDQALQVERAATDEALTTRGLLASGIVLAALVAALAALTSPLWIRPLGFPDPVLVQVALLWTAPGGAVLMILALLQSEDRLKAFAAVSVLATVGGQLLGLAGMVVFDGNAVVYAAGGVFSQFLALGVGLVLTRPRLRGAANWPVLRRAFRLGLPLMLTGLSIFVINVSDRLVTQRLLGSVEVGRFQVAYTLGYVMVLVLSFTNRAWIPRLAKITDVADRWRVICESRDGIIWLLMPAVLGLTLAAPVALRIVAPSSFRPGGLLVVVFLVSLAAFPVAAIGASARMLITLRRGRPLAWSALGGVLVKVGANIVLVPMIGISGAAVATLIALSVQVFIQSRSLPAGFAPERPGARLILTGLLVCAFAAGTVLLPQTLPWNLARFGAGLLCLPWLWISLSRLRSGRPSRQPSVKG